MGMSNDMADFNAQIIDEFRTNGGRVGGPFEGAPMVLLHHTGAKTGTERVTPLMSRREGDDLYIFASKAGAPDNPDWFHNLRANPQTTIEVPDGEGVAEQPVTAVVAEGDERERVWENQKRDVPQFAGYEASTDRTIPVVRLDPR
ncbi:MAG: nitroreductase family deazaflavin-dependent oxidoreductase [Acidimicrobiales bacterium]|nr:nitroreductase family deazaflavin-dependent oxidoreductase [Acidimicrobiales bacterium]